MKDGLVPAQGRIPNFGDSLEAVTLGAVSGAACTPRRGVGGAREAGRARQGTAQGLGVSECRLPLFVRGSASDPRRGSGEAGAGPEVRPGARGARPRECRARPGAGRDSPGRTLPGVRRAARGLAGWREN